jgi:molecular chaperone GrpE
MSHGKHHHEKHHHNEPHQPEEKVEPNGTEPAEPKTEPKTVTVGEMELEQLRRELADFKDKYLRTLAEGENARKRMQKEKQESNTYAIQNLIGDFLHPIDHFENALKFTQDASDEVRHWGLGFQMILAQLKDVLTNNNVVSIESKGKPFDHNVHEAVETIETNDYPPGTIVEEFIKGYKMGEKVIRPARVKVAKAPAPPPAASPEQEDKIS